MSTPGFVFHQRSPSSPTIPLEPDFPSPPVIRPYPPNTRPQPISPSLGRSFGSDITSVSDTIRSPSQAHAHVHPQPGPSFSRSSTPGFTFASSASSAATLAAPATSDAGHSSNTITPSRFKLLGRQNPVGPADATTTGFDVRRPIPAPANPRTMLSDPADAPIFGSGLPVTSTAESAEAPAPRSHGTRSNVGRPDAAPLSSTSADFTTHHHVQPGPASDLPHLEAFEQSALLSSGWLNELGTMRQGLPPTVSRSSSGSERVPSPRPSSPIRGLPLYFPTARAGAPPVRPRIGFTAAPVSIPPAAQEAATATSNPPRRSGVADLFFAYGLTGPQLEQDADAVMSPVSQTATDGSAVSAMPSVPPPRPSRSMISDLYHDREDFSPHRLGRRSRDEADRTDRPNPTQAFGTIRPTSQMHRDRLARADAFRLRSGPLDPLVPAGQWTRSPYFDEDLVSDEPHGESRGRSSAMDVSSRQGRFALDDNRDLRSRVRRRLSINDPDSVEDREASTEIGTWNRDVQDAIGRRVAGDQPHSPASAARRHREISGPYSRARPVAERNGILERQRTPWQYPDWQAGMPWRGQDTIHVDTIGSFPRDPLSSGPPVAFGWRSHFGTAASASSATAQAAARQNDAPSMYSERSADLHHAASPDAQYRLPANMPEAFDAAGIEDEEMEEAPGVHPVFTAGVQLFGNYWPPYGLDPGTYPPRLAPHDMLGQLQFTAEMDQAERVKMARSIAKGIVRWPGSARRRAAETVVENKPWGDMESSEEMERDVCCSVCHDDYEPESKVSVTPCKHMYHKDCLDTWLQTPNTSSCPMCRRDLAVLACVTKMVPSKKREEAMPVWLAL